MDIGEELTLPSIPALALYAATLLVEVPVIFARMLVVLAASTVLLLVTTQSLVDASGYMVLAMILTAWSVLALVTPLGGGWWWRQNLGGRDPSEREQAAYDDAIDLLARHHNEPLRLPSGWFVIDTPHPDAAACGHTLALSRGLLESEHLPAVIAHELGHLHSSDGKLTAALNRLVLRPPPATGEKQESERKLIVLAPDRVTLSITLFGGVLWLARKLAIFAKGGFGLRLLAPFWGSYWREREFLADQHAARLGQAEELADFLEIHALIHDHPVPFIWLTEHTHPPTELRIDKLRRASLQPGAVAPGPEPVKAAPPGPPAAGPDGPTLTEPGPSAGGSLRSAGRTLPTSTATD
jgi:Zn-dependent protease with chaperone function